MSEAPGQRDDRERRERIIDAAIDVIVDHGVEGLTHRRVAESAGVSPSLVTYHFGAVEDLLEAALQEATQRDLTDVRRRFSAVSPVSRDDVPDLLAAYFADVAGRNQRKAILIMELYVGALRRERLRPIATTWNRAWVDMLTPLLGDAADTTTTLMGALTTMMILRGQDPDPTRMAEFVRAFLETGGAIISTPASPPRPLTTLG